MFIEMVVDYAFPISNKSLKALIYSGCFRTFWCHSNLLGQR